MEGVSATMGRWRRIGSGQISRVPGLRAGVFNIYGARALAPHIP